MHITELVKEYGAWFYAIVFLWTFIEGETVVILSGIAARHEVVDVKLVFIIAWIGSFCGDSLYFFLSRFFGKKIIDRYPKTKPALTIANKHIKKHAVLFILGYRFVYGVRNVSVIALGLSSIHKTKFIPLNFLAAGIWSAVFSFGGYLAGSIMIEMIGAVSSTAGIFLALLTITSIFALHKIIHKNRINQEQKEQNQENI